MLEASLYEHNAFVTLTYSAEHRPIGNLGGTLDPSDPQNWLKRLRNETAPLRLRYYLVGEYGDQTRRPHYHAALFNFPSCSFGTTRNYRVQRVCCDRCDLVSRTWGKGGILLGALTPESAQYIAGYVIKKMTDVRDPRLDGNYPEFARQSLRPGIGAGAMPAVATQIDAFNLQYTQADVPSALRHGNKLMPLGKYLRKRLRSELNLPDDYTRYQTEKSKQQMHAVYQASIDNPEVSPKQALLEANQAKVDRIVARYKALNAKKGNL